MDQQNAMQHGVESEKHEIATLASISMPFPYPELTFHEEGYYIETEWEFKARWKCSVRICRKGTNAKYM